MVIFCETTLTRCSAGLNDKYMWVCIMTTLKVEILKRYKALGDKIRNKVGYDLFPEIGAVDATDILCMVCQFFGNSGGDYRNTIINLAWVRGITVKSEDLEKVYPDIKGFIDFVLTEARKTSI